MINLTESAAKQVSKMLQEKEEGMLLRIFIEPGGCSGFEYGMSVDFPKDADQVADSKGVHYAVAGDSVDYLKDCEVHFDDGLTGKGFEIRNPNAQSTCGCGKSFS
ncbi:iron-sulfur cluster assembly accessory protein [Opitutales bacterium]|nr:iron-sulfur cluster assembly accessory protein [Opitutales bacterium]